MDIKGRKQMSVTQSRRISSSSAVVEKKYTARHGESFVETIDTTNNVSVRSDTNPDPQFGGNFPRPPKKEQPQIKADAPVVSNTIAALSASGIFDEASPAEQSSNIDIYNRNQSTIKDEELERTGHNYLKHFYEKNQPVEEIDKFI